MTWATVQLVLGIFLLFGGGDWLVEGAVALARRLGVPPLVVGLTIVGFGTSAPELLVSAVAAWKGSPEIALGNVVGSNIANVGLVLGLTGVLAPIPFAGRALGWNWLAMMAASVALAGASWLAGGLSWAWGVAFLAGLALFLGLSFLAGKKAGEGDGEKAAAPRFGLWTALAVTLAGCAGVAVGADFLVDGASFLARRWGVGERVIGLTIVAVGTSLPELATSLMAALKKQMDISVGNIVGSNIFNILGILGVAASIRPMEMPFGTYGVDLGVMLAFSLALGIPLAIGAASRRTATMPRLLAGALLVAYGGYAASLF